MNNFVYDDYKLITIRLMLALFAGGIIGLERALHGRDAGFRTHMLVCVSSSLLMVLMTYQWKLIPVEFIDTIRADPSRMAQGIMTGIGFLGAGVIIKDGFSVRGLTTAASIWMTASIGIVFGLGFYFAAVLTTIITLIALSLFRWIEGKLPAQKYARFTVTFKRNDSKIDENYLREKVSNFNIKAYSSSYRLIGSGKYFEYEMTIQSKNTKNFTKLTECLLAIEDIHGFDISPL